jgi:large subunit ribosomal protein L30
MLRIKLVRSPIGNNARNRATIKALGLRKIRQVVEHEDTPSIRGMIHKVKHMLEVEEVGAQKNSKPSKAESNGAGEKPKPQGKKKEPKNEEGPEVPAGEPEPLGDAPNEIDFKGVEQAESEETKENEN